VQTAPCYVQSFWHNICVWQTDGRNCCSWYSACNASMAARCNETCCGIVYFGQHFRAKCHTDRRITSPPTRGMRNRQLDRMLNFIGSYTYTPLPIRQEGKEFDMKEWTAGVLFHAIFHFEPFIVSPVWGKKPQMWLSRHIRAARSSFFIAALRSRCGHYIFALWFPSIFFFSSSNLSGRTLDVYHTSSLPHVMWS